jgi:hypothetical protein
MPKNIKKIFSDEFGFKEDKLNSLARILYHFEFDGVPRTSSPQQSDLDEILKKEIREEDLNDLLQKNIFKKIRGNGERQQIKPSDKFSEEVQLQLLQDFEKIGFVKEISPKVDKEYKSVIIFGATQLGMEARIKDFSEHFLPAMKSKPQEIFILAGEREGWLDSEPFAQNILLKRINESPKIKGEDTKTLKDLNDEIEGLPKIELKAEERKAQVKHFSEKYGITFPTETDIAKEIIESKKTELGDNITITFINAEKKPNGLRPDTTDTLRAFATNLKERPEEFGEASILAISNQPHVSTQDMAVRILDSDFKKLNLSIHTVGKAVEIDPNDPNNSSKLNGFLSLAACELAGTINRCPSFQKEVTPGPLMSGDKGAKGRVFTALDQKKSSSRDIS